MESFQRGTESWKTKRIGICRNGFNCHKIFRYPTVRYKKVREACSNFLTSGHLFSTHTYLSFFPLSIFVLTIYSSFLQYQHPDLRSSGNDVPDNLKNVFLPSSLSLFPSGNGNAIVQNRFHIALIFDQTASDISLSAIQSIAHYSKHELSFHLVAPVTTHSKLKNLSLVLPGTVNVFIYDYKHCIAPTSLLSHFATQTPPKSICKLFIAEIIPASYVLYMDSDATIFSDLSPCFLQRDETSVVNPFFGTDAMFGMGVDMSDVCQLDPDQCYPIGMKYKIPRGLPCGTSTLDPVSIKAKNLSCPSPGEYEPYRFSSALILMNLRRMREKQFTSRLVQATLYTWRSINQLTAKFGDQDFLNNYIRLYPHSVVMLPCGCNYQYAAVRREEKCPDHKIIIAYGSSNATKSKYQNPFLEHWLFFDNAVIDFHAQEHIHPPIPPKLSSESMDRYSPPNNRQRYTSSDMLLPIVDGSCSFQSYICSKRDIQHAQKLSIEILSDKVSVISLTNGQKKDVAELSKNIQEQSHPRVRHLVQIKNAYSNPTNTKANQSQIVDFPTVSQQLNPNQRCGRRVAKFGLWKYVPTQLQSSIFAQLWDCACRKAYSSKDNANTLNDHIKDGWVIYVEGNEIFESNFAISKLLANIKSRGSLVLFGSTVTGRKDSIKPFRSNGTFSNIKYTFHSSNLKLVKWPPLYCGEDLVMNELLEQLPSQRINHSFLISKPGFNNLKRSEPISHGNDKITVVITSYSLNGWRPQWLEIMVTELLSTKFRNWVTKVILVWNNPNEEVPQRVIDLESEIFEILRMKENSLNNRWVQVLKFVKTNIILNFDDDVYITREGLLCMLAWFNREPDRLVAPYVRMVNRTKYVSKSLFSSGPYSMALPRVIMLPTSVLHSYANRAHGSLHKYVDSQAAHCDDVLLNVIAQEANLPPLRVALPRKSVVDFSLGCVQVDKKMTEGIGLQSNRSALRSECIKHILTHFGRDEMVSVQETATCTSSGEVLELRTKINKRSYQSMIDTSKSSFCRKLKL